jgi:hypothetical protein
VRPALTHGDGGGGAWLRTGDERWVQTGYERSRLGQWRRRSRLQTCVVGVAREAASGGVRTSALSTGAFMARARTSAGTAHGSHVVMAR